MFSELRVPFRYPRMPVHPAEPQAASSTKRKAKAKDWKGTLRRIGSYLSESRGRLILVLMMVILSSSLALLGPVLVGRAVDHYIVTRDSGGLIRLILWLGAVYVIHSTSLYLQNIWMIGIAQNTVYAMRNQLFGHLHRLPVSFFDKRRHGELMSRITNDIENVSSTLNSSFIQILTSVLTLVGTISVMLWLSPLLTLLTLLVVPAMVFGMKWITRRTGRLFKEQQRNLGELNGYIEETMSGHRIVKTFSLEKKVLDEFREKNERLRNAGFWAQTISGFIPKLMNGLNNLSFAIIAGIGGILTLNGMISIGVIVIFTEYSRQFTRPLNDLANQWNTFLSAIAGAERVFEVLDEDAEGKDEGGTLQLEKIRGDIRFADVCFSYEEDNETIRGMSFHASPGETVALVGPTGAGKTTVINLLARFYDPDSGAIYVDGHDISTVSRKSLRSRMAFVLQDTFLFEGTVRENIRYGRLDATEREVEDAAKEAGAHSFIMKLSDGYDTVLKQGGSGISQGERQLLSIARAILADPAILILDEATSSIDTVTELRIQEALQRLMKGRTNIVIAHRLGTIRNADLILVLEGGGIAEQGSHEQLIAHKGFYYELYSGQTGDERRSKICAKLNPSPGV